MSSILESLSSAFGADTIGNLASALGTEPSSVNKALGAVGPLLLSGMSNVASTPAGADSLFKMLPQDTGMLGSLGSMLSGLLGGGASATEGGSSLLASLFGSGLGGITGSLSKALGFNVAPLLSLAAPAALSAVANAAKSKSLDASGLASLLGKETSDYMNNPANKDSASLVKSAIDAGSKATSTIASYGPDWAKVVTGPAAALFAVATSDLSGPIGSIQEAKAASDALANAVKQSGPNSVMAAAFGGGMTQDMLRQMKELAPTRDKLIDLIKAGAAAVAAKSPGEAQAYKESILAVAKAAAEASKEGGFLGMGGTLVSKDEQTALDAIKAALG